MRFAKSTSYWHRQTYQTDWSQGFAYPWPHACISSSSPPSYDPDRSEFAGDPRCSATELWQSWAGTYVMNRRTHRTWYGTYFSVTVRFLRNAPTKDNSQLVILEFVIHTASTYFPICPVGISGILRGKLRRKRGYLTPFPWLWTPDMTSCHKRVFYLLFVYCWGKEIFRTYPRFRSRLT